MIYMSNKNLNFEAYEDEGRLICGSNILDVFLINSWGGRLIRGSAYTRVYTVNVMLSVCRNTLVR